MDENNFNKQKFKAKIMKSLSIKYLYKEVVKVVNERLNIHIFF
jgi:hypothetical protein